jgi:hypothetical protein
MRSPGPKPSWPSLTRIWKLLSFIGNAKPSVALPSGLATGLLAIDLHLRRDRGGLSSLASSLSPELAMHRFLLLIAALAVLSPLAAQQGDGSTSAPPPALSPLSDGSLYGSAQILDGPENPQLPDGCVDGPRLAPLQDGCVSLNPTGGVLDSTVWGQHWFVHRVVAPRVMNVVSFDFFCQFSGGSGTVQTAIFGDLRGQPTLKPLVSAQMAVTATPGFRRSTLSTPLRFAKGQVFYIGYFAGNPLLRISLTKGTNGSYFWGSGTWTGPVTTRKFSWKVNCFEEGTLATFGSSGATESSTAKGQRHWVQAYNPDATQTDSSSWTKDGLFFHRLVAERDMLLTSCSLLSSVTSGTATLPTYLYDADANGAPRSLLSGSEMELTAQPRWNFSLWNRARPIARGTVFFFAYKAVDLLRVSIDEGQSSTYFYQPPGLSQRNGPYTTRCFGIRLHGQYADALNLQAQSIDTSAGYRANAQFLHEITAESDTWVNGFEFYCQASAPNLIVDTYLYLSDIEGKPRRLPARTARSILPSSPGAMRALFEPVFVPRGANYFIGYRTPTANVGSLWPALQGTGLLPSRYYWKDASATSFNGPYTLRPFRYAVIPGCADFGRSHPAGVSAMQLDEDVTWAVKVTAPRNMWIDGFEYFAETNSTSYLDVETRLWRVDASTGGPGSVLRAGKGRIGADPSMMRTRFDAPFFVAKGTVFYVGFVTPVIYWTRARPESLGLDKTSCYSRKGSAAWSKPVDTAVAYRILGGTGSARMRYSGTPEIGNTVHIQLWDASVGRIYGLLLSPSSQLWGPFPLPIGLPMWPGNQLYVGWDILLHAGSIRVTGNVSVPLSIPSTPGLIGLEVHHQFWVIENQASGLEMSFSNGGTLRIGG